MTRSEVADGCTVDFPLLRWKSAGNGDVQAWAALIARTAAVEKPVWFEHQPELEQIMESRKNPPEHNTVLGFDPDGVARAYARITKNTDSEKAYGFGCVDPQWQRRGVGSALLEWLEARTRQRFAEDAGAVGEGTQNGSCHPTAADPQRTAAPAPGGTLHQPRLRGGAVFQ